MIPCLNETEVIAWDIFIVLCEKMICFNQYKSPKRMSLSCKFNLFLYVMLDVCALSEIHILLNLTQNLMPLLQLLIFVFM